jgi:hypothetical protein
LQFPEWKRTLRSEIASASDHPTEAIEWIFIVEHVDVTYDDMKADVKDPFRGLDAKLQTALGKITKGEPARKLAIIMDKLAETGKLLSGRQHLLFLYLEFKKDGHKTDAIAYGNLEKIVFKGDEGALEHFLTLWDSLLMTFRAQPSDDHLYATFHSRVKSVPGLKIVIDYLDRIDYEHVDKTYSYLMNASRGLVDRRRTERQTTEFNKLYSGATSHALPADQKGGSKGDKGAGKGAKKDMVCFSMRDKGTCENGKACTYSHDPQNIKAAKAAALAEKGKDQKGGGKGDKGGGKGKVCGFFLSGTCKKGAACDYSHTQPAAPAAPAAPDGTTPAQLAAGSGQG